IPFRLELSTCRMSHVTGCCDLRHVHGSLVLRHADRLEHKCIDIAPLVDEAGGRLAKAELSNLPSSIVDNEKRVGFRWRSAKGREAVCLKVSRAGMPLREPPECH